jgi:proteasome activator subunit 4
MHKYPVPREKRVALARLYFHICTTPGMPTHLVATCADQLVGLTRSKKKIMLEDLRLPWKPLYKILSKDLFLTRRQVRLQSYIYSSRYATNCREV